MPIDPSAVQWDAIDPTAVQWDKPKPIGAPQPLTFAEQYIAPTLEKVFGTNIQGSPTGRFIQGAADLPIGAEQFVANAVGAGPQWNQRVHDLEQNYQQERAAAGNKGADWMRLAGNTSTALLAPTPGAVSGVLPALGQGAVIGGLYNAAQPVTDAQPANLSSLITGQQPNSFWNEKGKQVGLGEVFGAGGAAVGGLVGRMLSPNTSKDVKTLMDAGVVTTPGQTLGGAWQRAEDASTSIPVLGDFVRDAKNRTLADFNRAAYARALAPIGQEDLAKTLPPGPEGIAGVKAALGDAYNAVLPKLNWKGDQQFTSQLNDIEQMALSGLPDKEASAYRQILSQKLSQMTPTGRMDGQTFKEVESSLGSDAKSFMSSGDTYQRKLGQALRQTQQVFRDALDRSNPDDAGTLSAINQGYANFARLRAAGASAGDKSGGFTPAQLASAIRSLDSSVGKGNTATGTALMQDLSNAGRAVLPSTVADSGTPLRHAVQLGIGALAGHSFMPEAAAGYVAPTLAAGGLMTLPYTAYGQKLAMALLAQRPQGAAQAANLVRQSAPLLGAAAAPMFLPSAQ